MSVINFNAGRGRGSRQRSPEETNIVAALDVGSTKVSCLIAERMPPRENGASQKLRIRGAGHQASGGMRAGAVVDIEAADRAIRLAVEAAERAAGVRISEVIVAVSGGRPRCDAYTGETYVMSADIGPADTQRAISSALRKLDGGGRALLHVTPVQYHIDDAHGVKQPLGMFGQKLSVDLNAVTVEPGAIKNLGLAIGRCHLDITNHVIAPYAGARAVLVDDELELGATYVEMGGATTGIAAFCEGRLIFADVIPVGGQHITNDIARGLSTSIAHAERLKTLFGSALPALDDDREHITVPLLGEQGVDKVHHLPRSMLTGIIRPRVEEILELVRDRLAAAPFGALAGNRIVLGGGSSQLTGLREAASLILNRQVRAGMPRGLYAMPESARIPGFSVAMGLLDYAMKPDLHVWTLAAGQTATVEGNYISRVGKWIKESF
jgi:cell division protein FtsA